MLAWIWIAVAVASAVAELFTKRFIAISFLPGAIAAAILDFLDIPSMIQFAVVFSSAIVIIVFAELILIKKMRAKSIVKNINSIVGEKCVVTEKIDNYAGCGHVKVKGLVWSARGVGDDDIFEAGEVLRVVALEGVKVVCRK